MSKTKYTEIELKALIERQLTNSLGADGTEIAQLRARNLQYYYAEPEGELAGPDIPNRSSIVATDVPDTVEWMLPSLVRVFAQSKDSLQCEPRRPQYAPSAKLAEEYLKQMFWERLGGFTILHHWFKDALIQKVGFVKVYWDDDAVDSEESYAGLLPEQVQMLLDDPSVRAVEQEARTETVAGQQVQVFDMTISRKGEQGRVVVENVPPEEMRIHRRARYGQDPIFIAQVMRKTRGELEEEGYDLDNVSNHEGYTEEELQRVRGSIGTSYGHTSDDEGELEEFRVADCYLRIDYDGDGVQEWRRVLMIGDEIFENEKSKGHPFVSFCPSPMPHVFFGQCPTDQAIQPTRFNTALLRSLSDNVQLTVNKRMGVVEGQVNIDDLVQNRPGGVVRMRTPDALVPIEQGGLDPGAWQMVEWGEQWRERRTGFTRYSQGLSPDALNPTATGVNVITEKADQRVELIARIAAQSVAEMFTKVLDCAAHYQKSAEIVELMGEWVMVDPREWSNGFRIKVDVGLGTGSRDRKAAALAGVIQTQMPLLQAGQLPAQAMIVAARDLADAAGLNRGDEYFPDAPPPGPQQPPPQVLVKQMELQADAQKFQAQTVVEAQRAELEANLERERMAAQQQVDITRQQAEAEQQALKAKLEAELREREAQMKAMLEQQQIEFNRWKAEYDRETALMLESLRQMNAPQPAGQDGEGGEGAAPANAGVDQAVLVKTIEAVSAALDKLSKPRTIVRGPDGRAQGIV
jgi:hypothetical protein